MTKKSPVTDEKSTHMMAFIKHLFQLPQTNSGFIIARLLASSGPSAQIFIAIMLSYRLEVPIRDLLFVTLYPLYLYLANSIRFDSNSIVRQRAKSHPHNISNVMSKFFSGSDDQWFKKYIGLAAMIGLVAPLIYISCAPAPGQVSLLAARHMFVLWCQIIGESIVMFNPNVHRFITLLVPLGFSVYRLNLLVEWFLGSVSLFSESGANYISVGDAWWSVILSSLNLVFWTYNLFVALLLKITPEFLCEEKCEYPEMQVITLPFVKEPSILKKEVGKAQAKQLKLGTIVE